MKKSLFISIFLVICIFSLTACHNDPLDSISNEIGIDITHGKEISFFDDHGGFHGDGQTYAVIKFSDNNVLNSIKNASQWKTLPLDETIKTLICGVKDENFNNGPYLADNNGNAVFPPIKKGYYLFIDRNNEGSSANILNRFSFNFTITIYDIDTNTLHYGKLDT